MDDPKVLIVGQYFNSNSGGGITISNLFKGWNKENLLVVADNMNNPEFNVCNKYYRIGNLEIKRRFPFNLGSSRKQISSGVLNENISSNAPISTINKTSRWRNKYVQFLKFTGLYHYKVRYQVSKQLLNWINTYSPDIIYTHLGDIQHIQLVNDLHQKLGLPVAIHIMDDWPDRINENGLFNSYWSKIIDKKFRSLLSSAKVLLSISDAMSNEYLQRYGLKFIPFHNPINVEHWGTVSSKSYEKNDPFIILYAGRIGPGIKNCLLDIIDSLETLTSKGLKIEFQIQATNYDRLLDEVAKFNFVKLNPVAKYNELPKIFSNADTLLLGNDFDKNSISFLKYSMPTKASEYMISGTPVLLYSSGETAVTQHAITHKWAYIVSEKKKEKLEEAIFELYNDERLRMHIGETAKAYAKENYDDKAVRERFKKSLMVHPKENQNTTNT